MNEKGGNIRFRALDAWRGLCAAMIALLHLNVVSDFDVPLVRNSWVFVDFFFVLSGFVITHGYWGRISDLRSALHFVGRRFARIWPLHAVVLLILIGLELAKLGMDQIGFGVRQAAFSGATSLTTLPAQLLLLNSWHVSGLTWNLPSWSIGAEFYTYLTFAGLVLLTRWNWSAAAAIALVGAVAVAALSPRFMATTYDYGLFRCLYGFHVGYLTYRLWQKTAHVDFSVRTATALEGLALIGVVLFVNSQTDPPGPLSMPAPVIFAGAVYIFSLQRGHISNLLLMNLFQKPGKHSYSIYMIHFPIVVTLNRAVKAMEQLLHVPLTIPDPVQVGDIPLFKIFFVNTHVMDGIVVAYLLCVLWFARWIYQYVEMPGQIRVTKLLAQIEEKRRSTESLDELQSLIVTKRQSD